MITQSISIFGLKGRKNVWRIKKGKEVLDRVISSILWKFDFGGQWTRSLSTCNFLSFFHKIRDMSDKTLHQLRGPHIWYPHQVTVKFWQNSIFNAKYKFSNANFRQKRVFLWMLGKCLWEQADYEMWGKNKPSFNSWDLCPYFNHYVTTLSDFRDSDIFVIFYRTTWEGQWAKKVWETLS